MILYYVTATKTAYPHAVKKVAGPFEDWREADAGAARIKPDYPGCIVSAKSITVNMKRGAELLGGPRIEEKASQ